MNKQEAFDKALFGIRAQGGWSFAGTCLYRSPNGRRCAIGHLLEDSEYMTKMEGKDVNVIFSLLPVRLQMLDESLAFLKNLQDVHDKFAITCDDEKEFLRLFEIGMRAFAEKEGLNYEAAAVRL